jgi:hypothetical protein
MLRATQHCSTVSKFSMAMAALCLKTDRKNN